MGNCATETAALRGLLETEYAERAFYAAAKDPSDKLEWYSAMADLAGSDDLGFTTGPWIYTIFAATRPPK